MRARWRAKPIVSPRGTKVDGFRACKRTRSTHPTIHDVKQRNSFSRHLRPRFEIVRPDRGADGAPRGAPGVERRANELRHADACEALASLSPQGWPASRRSNRGGFHPRGPHICRLGSIRSLLAGSAPPGCLAAVASGPRDVVTNRSPRDAKPAPLADRLRKTPLDEKADTRPTRLANRSQYRYS